MAGSDLEVIQRLAWLFNHMLEPDGSPYREELERIWAPEPEIVPMRAAHLDRATALAELE